MQTVYKLEWHYLSLLSIDLALLRKSWTACGGNIYLKQRPQLTLTLTRLRSKT